MLIGLLGLGAAIYFVAAHGDDADTRQVLVMKLIGLGATCVALAFIWLVAFSRTPWRTRLISVGGLALTLAILAGTVEFGGVSGDLVPIFRWKWSKPMAIERGVATDDAILNAASFPQFLGQHRNASVPDLSLAKDWETNSPALLWRKPIGESWSGFAISGPYAVTQEQSGEEELVSCYNLVSGELIWQESNSARYDNPLGGVGPRATPAIDGDRVYTVGGLGFVACRELTTGAERFSFNLLESNEAPLPEWGVAGSPLIHDGLLILNAGGSDGRTLVAYDKLTGTEVWSGGDDKAHWSSPVAFEVHGETQFLIFNRGGVSAHSPNDGSVLWTFPWKRSTGTPRVAVPVQLPDNRFVVSSGYGAGASMFEIVRTESGYKAEEAWRTLHLKAKFNNFVYRDGYLYGLDDGMMTCIDTETGRRTWKKGRYGHGQLLLGDDWILVLAENGDALLLEPNPEEPVVLGSFPALEGKSWNPPALAGPYLLLRNHLEVACYRLPLSE